MSAMLREELNDDCLKENSNQTILVTGGAGYIGSHTVLLLLEQKYKVVVIDNCSYVCDSEIDSNGNHQSLPESLKRIQKLTHSSLEAFYNFDLVNDGGLLDRIFIEHNIKAVLHFAALKVVSESINIPLEYYTNNIIGTINLLNSMKRVGCYDLIFSSSATIYGIPRYLPVDEKHQVGINVLNPYGRGKCMIEQILKDLCDSKSIYKDAHWNVISLRYFNPVGAHPSGLIGEHITSVPNNLMPYISQVAIRKRQKVFVFGSDYDTPDGTGVRDFIHIVDLANGHIYALRSIIQSRKLNKPVSKGCFKAYNLGTGRGYSVIEAIKTYEEVNKVSIPFQLVERREGDAGSVYADVSLAKKELNWSAKFGIHEMVRDAHKWQTNCPNGYKNDRECQS